MIGFIIPLLLQSKQAQDHRLSSEQMDHLMNLRKRRSQSDLSSNPLSEQVGGSHYKNMKIQPVEFIMANDLNFLEGNVVKYICRYKQKGGVEDLNKVIHYARLLIEQIEKEKNNV